MSKTFWSVDKARIYAKKTGGTIYNNPKGYSNKKVGFIIVKGKKTKIKPKIIKASTYTHAKKGYLAFLGSYPNMRHKYFTSKSKAIKWK